MKHIVLMLILVALLASCKPRTPDDLPSTLEVYGSARRADITWSVEGHRESRENVPLPWKHEFELDVDDRVSVYATSSDGGDLRCAWSVEGGEGSITSDHDTAEGYKSVSCAGTWAGFRYE